MTQPQRRRPEILTDMASSVSQVCLVGKFKLSLWEYHSVGGGGYFDTLLSQSPKATAIWDTEVSVCPDIECPPEDSCVWGSLYSWWTLSCCCVLHDLDPRALTRGSGGMKKW